MPLLLEGDWPLFVADQGPQRPGRTAPEELPLRRNSMHLWM
jgi:hypothetical protein